MHTLAQSKGGGQIAWSPDGKWIAAGCDEKTVRMWKEDGTPGSIMKGHKQRPYCVEFSPDGLWLASACRDSQRGDKSVRLWRLDGSPGPILDDFAAPVTSISWAPDSHHLVAGIADRTVRVWAIDAPTGSPTPTGPLLKCSEGNESPRVYWSPNGKWIACTSGAYIDFWQPDGTDAGKMKVDRQPFQVTWSDDGSRFIWRVHTDWGRRWLISYAPEKRGSVGYPHAMDFPDAGSLTEHFTSPDGNRVCSIEGTTVKWYSAGGKLEQANRRAWVPSVDSYDAITSWSPDGQSLATIRKDRVARLWRSDGMPGRVLGADAGLQGDIAWSPDSQWLASGARGLAFQLWSPEGTAGKFAKADLKPHGICFSPSGDQIAVRLEKSGIRVWSLHDLKSRILGANEGRKIAWSPDGQWIAAPCASVAVRLWKPDGTAGPVLEGHGTTIEALAWSPNGNWLASCSREKNGIRLWKPDGAAGPVINSEAITLAWSPDSSVLASGSSRAGGKVHLWNTNGQLVRSLNVYELMRIDWASTGKLAVMSLSTHSVIDPTTGDCEWTAVAFTDGHSAVFGPGGELRFATKTGEEALTYVVETPDGRLIPYTVAEFLHRINRPPEQRALQWAIEAGGEIELLDIEPAFTEKGVIDVDQLPANLGQVEISLSVNEHLRDAMLRHLVPLAGLVSLDVSATGVSNDALPHVGKMTSLRRLNLAGTQVTALGCENLTGLNALEVLDFSHTATDDRVIPHLKNLTGLKEVRLVGTEITSSGIQRLREHLPDCTIITKGVAATPSSPLSANGGT
jgi:WD40 repeat protein